MIRTWIITVLIILTCTSFVRAQDDFYDPDQIQEIHIVFSQSNWSYVLDSLFVNYGDEGRLIGDVTINGKVLKNAGIRYKGFSSWNESEIKNPLNIDLDYTIVNQNYKGHVKIKLSNVIHDPSFVREVLSYEIARKYMPSPEANFARVYINDSLIGLYTNVEAVDKYFVADRFGSPTNCFVKGEPQTLEFPFGQNANLAYTHGNDSSGYMAYYNMESTTGWNKLFHFIRILNNAADSIGLVLNTDRALWMHAFNYSLLNLDSYIGYSQNYYLYQDNQGRFNPIVWDLNMSFGSFRNTDGSTNFLGLTIPKIKILDPLQQMTFSVSPRPLMTQLFADYTWRRMYLAHIRTIMNENFINNAYYARAKELQLLIDSSVQADSHKFYSYQDFLDNADTTIGETGSLMQYPGLKDLMEARVQYLSAYSGFTGEPEISDIGHQPQIPAKGETLWITAKVSSANSTTLAYRCGNDAVFTKVAMNDDGASQDGLANDGTYGASLVTAGGIVQYYIYAENDSAGTFSPERAEYEFYSVQPEIEAGSLVINEVYAGGNNAIAGENVSTNDWVELFNTSTESIQLNGFSLSLKSGEAASCTFPDTVIGAGKYFIVWADGAGGQHAGFTIPGSAGITLSLSNSRGTIIDQVTLSSPVSGKTTGRYPNGYGTFEYMQPTAGKANSMGSTPETGFSLYPNPATDKVTIEFSNIKPPYAVQVFSGAGLCVYNQEFPAETDAIQSIAIPLDVSQLNGLYLVKLNSGNSFLTKKLIVY